MKDLITINNDGQPVASSRDIAEHFNKDHKHVLRDIENLIGGLPNFGHTPMFIKSTYVHPQNGQMYPMYYMTRDGFSLLVMGFTGKSALEWKLKYIEAFNRMEEQIRNPKLSPAEQLLEQAKLMVEQERRLRALEIRNEQASREMETVKDAIDIMVAPSVTAENWQSQMNRNVRSFCMQTGFDFHATFQQLYADLEVSAGVKLSVRVKFAQQRLQANGATQSEIAAVSKLSIIAKDKKLREIFNGLFNRMVARYKISGTNA